MRPPAPPYLPASRLLPPVLLRLFFFFFLLLSSFLPLSPSPCCLGLFMEIHSFMPSHRSLSVSLPPGGRACDASPLSSHFLLSQSGAAPAPERPPGWDTRGQRRAVGPSPSEGGERRGGGEEGMGWDGGVWARHRRAPGGTGGLCHRSPRPRIPHPTPPHPTLQGFSVLSLVRLSPRRAAAHRLSLPTGPSSPSQPSWGTLPPLFSSLLAHSTARPSSSSSTASAPAQERIPLGGALPHPRRLEKR